MKIFLSGSLAYDRIMDFPGKFADHILPEKIHILNVCFMVNGMQEKFGGTAGNIAYNLAMLGEKPLIIAAAGKDFDTYETWLKQLDLPLEGIRKIPDEFTAGAYITTDMADNQITGFNPGAMKFPARYDFDGAAPEAALAIVAPGNLEDMTGYCAIYKEKKIPYICDPGQSIPALTGDQLADMITGSQILISNDYELEMISQSTGLDKAAILARAGAVITTLGENGALVSTTEKDVTIPAVKAEKVSDPTGAGDAFRAGLIKGLIEKKPLETAARMGAVCASFSVERHGTQEHRFTLDQFERRFMEAFPKDAI